MEFGCVHIAGIRFLEFQGKTDQTGSWIPCIQPGIHSGNYQHSEFHYWRKLVLYNIFLASTRYRYTDPAIYSHLLHKLALKRIYNCFRKDLRVLAQCPKVILWNMLPKESSPLCWMKSYSKEIWKDKLWPWIRFRHFDCWDRRMFEWPKDRCMKRVLGNEQHCRMCLRTKGFGKNKMNTVGSIVEISHG